MKSGYRPLGLALQLQFSSHCWQSSPFSPWTDANKLRLVWPGHSPETTHWSCPNILAWSTPVSRYLSTHYWLTLLSSSLLDASTWRHLRLSMPWLERDWFCSKFHFVSQLLCFCIVVARQLICQHKERLISGCLGGCQILQLLSLELSRWSFTIFRPRCLSPGVIWVSFSFWSGITGYWHFLDYTSVVIGAMALFSLVNWIIHARKHYEGPRLPQEFTEPEILELS